MYGSRNEFQRKNCNLLGSDHLSGRIALGGGQAGQPCPTRSAHLQRSDEEGDRRRSGERHRELHHRRSYRQVSGLRSRVPLERPGRSGRRLRETARQDDREGRQSHGPKGRRQSVGVIARERHSLRIAAGVLDLHDASDAVGRQQGVELRQGAGAFAFLSTKEGHLQGRGGR